MRPKRVAAAQRSPSPAAPAPRKAPASASAPTDDPTAIPVDGTAQTVAVSPQRTTLRTGQEELAFRFDLGFALDGAALSGNPSQAGHVLNDPTTAPSASDRLAQIRSYGFGEIFLGSRGLVLPTLTAFLSAHYRLANPIAQTSPIAEPSRDTNELEVRSAWAEARDPAARKWLAPLRLRAGRFYVYGPWVTHVDGVTVGWDGPVVTANLTLGGRVTALTAGERGGIPSPMAQVTARADFTNHKRKLPLVAGVELLTLDEHNHVHAQLAWQPRPTLAIGAATRALDGRLVNQRVSVRGRFREINAIFAELVHRRGDDWRWDPAVVRRQDLASDYRDPETDATEARTYLELGPVLPRLTGQLRAGTVLFDNVDLLARVAFAGDLRSKTSAPSSFSAAYVEVGGAFEVRLRRTLAVGGSLISRTTQRQEVLPVLDLPPPAMGEAPQPGVTDPLGMPLPADGTYGEKSFVEGGGTVRLSLGARILTFAGELYARRTRYAELYTAPDADMLETIDYETTHLGGRTSVDAWVNRRLRVMARYEVVTEVKRAPEVTGFKSLRVIVEATF
jgi:hypothetical protein